MESAVISWFKSHLPTRDSIGRNRWLKPFSHHLLRRDLWRFNRRSVPRAVAVGLFVAPVVPVAHTIIAAAFAVPARANIVVAAAVTWLINPLTFAPFYYAAYQVGRFFLGEAPHVDTRPSGWFETITSKLGPAALGTVIVAFVTAALGYFLAGFLWRVRIGMKWRARIRLRNRQ